MCQDGGGASASSGVKLFSPSQFQAERKTEEEENKGQTQSESRGVESQTSPSPAASATTSSSRGRGRGGGGAANERKPKVSNGGSPSQPSLRTDAEERKATDGRGSQILQMLSSSTSAQDRSSAASSAVSSSQVSSVSETVRRTVQDTLSSTLPVSGLSLTSLSFLYCGVSLVCLLSYLQNDSDALLLSSWS